jgi:hypothetical protein
MNKEELIKRLEGERSLVEFYGLKGEILRQLRGAREGKEARKTELLKLPMAELRKIGSMLGAKDTKKSELVEEILNKEGL